MGQGGQTVRPPAVAGQFYPADPRELRAQVESLISGEPRPALAALVPHAGYIYSGAVAGAVFGSVLVPDRVVVLCFDHRMGAEQFGVWTHGAWRTPLGDVPIASDLAVSVAGCAGAVRDPSGHRQEHSGEVQLPFLQVRNPRVTFVPVSLSCRLDAAPRLERFGTDLAQAAGDALVVASSDLNHYEADEPTRKKDAAVIEAIKALDAAALIDAIETHDISMCGYAPALAMIAYARARGATAARLVKYDTSAATSGDFDRVVGYSGMVVEKGS